MLRAHEERRRIGLYTSRGAASAAAAAVTTRRNGGAGWPWLAPGSAVPSPSALPCARHSLDHTSRGRTTTRTPHTLERERPLHGAGAVDRCAAQPMPPPPPLLPLPSQPQRSSIRHHQSLGKIGGSTLFLLLLLLLLTLLPSVLASYDSTISQPPGRAPHAVVAAAATATRVHDPLPSSDDSSSDNSDSDRPPSLSARDFALLSLSGLGGLDGIPAAGGTDSHAVDPASASDGEGSFDTGAPWYTPDQPLPPDNVTYTVPPNPDGTGAEEGAAPYRVPVSKRLGIWSFQCCHGCASECGGQFVHRVCLNRSSSEVLSPFSCSLIPSIPVSSYLDWALSNCSMADCPAWKWDGTYNSSELTCGRALAFPNVECERNGATEKSHECFPLPRPTPIFINQSSCQASDPALALLSFSATSAAAPFTPRQFFDMATLNGRIFLIGGLTRRNAQISALPADVWVSSNLGQTWSRIPVQTASFTAVQDHTVEVIGSSLFVFGGFQNGAPSMNVWRSDDQGSNWFVSGYLLSGRAQHASASFLNGIVIVGGFSQSSVQNSVLRSTDASHFYLQTSNAAWSPRTYPRLAVLADALIMCGGWLPHGVAATDVWKTYDAVQWTQVTAALPFSPRIGYVFYSSYRTLLLMGGISETGSGYFTEQWISGDLGQTWQLRQPQTVTPDDGKDAYVTASFSPRAWPAFIKLDEHVVVVGGEYKGQLLNDVWGATRGKTQSQLTINPPTVDPAQPAPGAPGRDSDTLSNTALLGVIIGAIVGGAIVCAVVFVVWKYKHGKRGTPKQPAPPVDDAAVVVVDNQHRPEGVAMQPIPGSPAAAAAAAAAGRAAHAQPVGEGEVRLQLVGEEGDSPLSPAQLVHAAPAGVPVGNGGNGGAGAAGNGPSQRSFSSSIAGALFPPLEQGGLAHHHQHREQAEGRDMRSHVDTAPPSQVRPSRIDHAASNPGGGGAHSSSRSHNHSRTPSAGGAAHSTPKHLAMLSPAQVQSLAHHHYGAGAGAGASGVPSAAAAAASSGSGRSSARNSRSSRRSKLARSNSATPRRSATDDELRNAVASAALGGAMLPPPAQGSSSSSSGSGSNGSSPASPILLHHPVALVRGARGSGSGISSGSGSGSVSPPHPSSLLLGMGPPSGAPSPSPHGSPVSSQSAQPSQAFAIDPAQVAWMQAQIQYQASVLAAVVAAQQQQLQSPGAASSAAAVAAATAAAAAAVATPIPIPPPVVVDAGDEYFCSVPQLSQQQAQVVYMSPSPLALSLPLSLSLPLAHGADAPGSSAASAGSPSSSSIAPPSVSTIDELEPGAHAGTAGAEGCDTDTADGGCGARAHPPLDAFAPSQNAAAANLRRARPSFKLQAISETDADVITPGGSGE